MNRRWLLVWGSALILLLAAACGGAQQATVAPSPTPAGTPTPAPPGMAGNPLRILLRPSADLDSTALQEAATALTSALSAHTAVDIQVLPVERYAEALALLCSPTDRIWAVAWLDGLSYAAAASQNCGIPTLQVRRDTQREVETGASGQLILSGSLGTGEPGAITGRTFCRISSVDFYSWLLPVVALRARNLDLWRAPSEIVDYPDVPALIGAVADGDCAAAGIAEDAFEQYQIEDAVRENVRVALTTVPFPFAVLMFPIEVDLGVRLELTEAFMRVAEDETTAGTLRTLLLQDTLVAAQPSDFTDFLDYLNTAGLDLAQLGG